MTSSSSEEMSKKVTFVLDDETYELLDKISKSEFRSKVGTVKWLLRAYQEINFCYNCIEREKCPKYMQLNKKLINNKSKSK